MGGSSQAYLDYLEEKQNAAEADYAYHLYEKAWEEYGGLCQDAIDGEDTDLKLYEIRRDDAPDHRCVIVAPYEGFDHAFDYTVWRVPLPRVKGSLTMCGEYNTLFEANACAHEAMSPETIARDEEFRHGTTVRV